MTDALERAFRSEFVQVPRVRAVSAPHVLHNLPCISRELGLAGIKSYLSGPAGVGFVTLVFDLETCALKAVVESARLGQLRTGCATALAARYLAVPGPQRLALFGTGTVARGQLEALHDELPLERVRAYSRKPNPEFQRWAAEQLGIEVDLAASVEECAEGANLVVTATTAREPFLRADMLAPECHVSAVGANQKARREIDPSVVAASQRIVVDDVEQARVESGELTDLSGVESLARLVSQPRQPRPPRTLFKSLGVGIEDLATAALLTSR